MPAAALLNSRTLRRIYPSIALEGFYEGYSSSSPVLTGTQLISIHLALHRPKGNSYSKDPHFGPYIDTLPRSFDSHPLTWLIKRKKGKTTNVEETLSHNLPPSASKTLQEVEKRFWNDWEAAVRAKVGLSELTSLQILEDSC